MDREKPKSVPIVLSGTSGAVPVKNEKGEISMQKVKVIRYKAGKRPDYAPTSDNEEDAYQSEESSEEEVKPTVRLSEPLKTNVDDRRLRRLKESEKETGNESTRDRLNRHRQIAEPVVLNEDEEDMELSDGEDEAKNDVSIKEEARDDDVEIDEDERMKRRMELKKKALQKQEELLKVEEEQNQLAGSNESESDEESEYEEYSDSDDEIAAPRLKPVFVRKNERATILEKEKELAKEKQIEKEKDRLHAEAKKHTKKIIEEEISREKLTEQESDDKITCDFLTDDENEEINYEAWKLRELKRIKRDRDEREANEKEKQELQRIRNMTEEERLAYLKANPKVIVNKAEKGKYKFLQKYYHRGAFFLDKEDEVFKQDFAQPTLEDHFDKTILPKVMQVKNFGMAGRTKYTHLLDQDTTRQAENPWSNQEKFITGRGGGTKQVFDKPTAKRRK